MPRQTASNDNSHPELKHWLKLALTHSWPEEIQPRIERDELLIPVFAGATWETAWVRVRSRDHLLDLLGY